jgi:hypothetical protein
MGLAHPEAPGPDGPPTDRLQPAHPGGLGRLLAQLGGRDVVQGAVERVDDGGDEHPTRRTDELAVGGPGGDVVNGHRAPNDGVGRGVRTRTQPASRADPVHRRARLAVVRRCPHTGR